MEVNVYKNQTIPALQKHEITEEEMKANFNFQMAEKFSSNLLKRGLISKKQYTVLMEKNRRSFPSFYASYSTIKP